MSRFAILLTLLLALTPLPASAADPIIGQAPVIDGDTIEIHAINAPESGQTVTCEQKDG